MIVATKKGNGKCLPVTAKIAKLIKIDYLNNNKANINSPTINKMFKNSVRKLVNFSELNVTPAPASIYLKKTPLSTIPTIKTTKNNTPVINITNSTPHPVKF
jgi:hypothetical protein